KVAFRRSVDALRPHGGGERESPPSGLRSGDQHPEVVAHDAPADPPPDAAHAVVSGPSESVAPLEHADPSLAAGAHPLPAEEPSLALLDELLVRYTSGSGHTHPLHARLRGRARVPAREKPSVCGEEIGCLAEDPLVRLHG